VAFGDVIGDPSTWGSMPRSRALPGPCSCLSCGRRAKEAAIWGGHRWCSPFTPASVPIIAAARACLLACSTVHGSHRRAVAHE
jgi:hypothetical protein